MSAKADYSVYRITNGEKLLLKTLVNGDLSQSSWTKNHIKGTKRVSFYDDISDIALSVDTVTYEVHADIKGYADPCNAGFSNHTEQNSISLCELPIQGDWTIRAGGNCVVKTATYVPANIVVGEGATLTISDGGSLQIDLARNFLKVRQGGKLLIEPGGKLQSQ